MVPCKRNASHHILLWCYSWGCQTGPYWNLHQQSMLHLFLQVYGIALSAKVERGIDKNKVKLKNVHSKLLFYDSASRLLRQSILTNLLAIGYTVIVSLGPDMIPKSNNLPSNTISNQQFKIYISFTQIPVCLHIMDCITCFC